MARVWSSGYELQSTTAGVEWSGWAGTFAINTSIVRGGLASARFNPTTASGASSYTLLAADNTGTYYMRGDFYIASLPTSISTSLTNNNTDVTIMGFQNAGGLWVEVTINASGVIRVYQDGSSRAVVGTSSALATGRFHRIELAYGSAASYIECRVNGVSIGSTTSASGLGGQNSIIVGIGIASTESCTADIYWDNIAVNDTSGSFQTSWPGDGVITHLQPNAAGDNNAFTVQVGGTAGSSNNYTRVSEITPDDVTSYNGDALSGDIDDLNVTDTTATIGTNDAISVVAIGVRYRAVVAAAEAAFKVRAKKTSGGTVSSSSAITPNSTTWKTNANADPRNYPLTLYQDPDSSNWTKATLDSAQIGYTISTTNTNAANVSTVWALVDSVPSLTISVSDTLTTSESIKLLVIDNISPSDSITNTESLSHYSDQIDLMENLRITLVDNVSVSDSITTSESIGLLESVQSSITENITITESVALLVISFISVSDTITTSESSNVCLVLGAIVMPGIQQIGGVRIV